MKRRGLLALAAAASIALAGCDSGEISSNSLNGIHVIGLGEGARCDFPIQWWTYSPVGIEARINGVRCWFSDGTYILIGDPDKCPICDLKGE